MSKRFGFRETFIRPRRLRPGMGSDRQSVPVSLPPGLVDRLDGLVEDDVFGSWSEALRYGARLAVREAHHERADGEARKDVEERLDRKRVS